jgi:NADPH:quinone reductase
MPVPSSIPSTQRASVLHKTGGPEVLTFESQYPAPKLEDLKTDQILVKNVYSGINFIGEWATINTTLLCIALTS